MIGNKGNKRRERIPVVEMDFQELRKIEQTVTLSGDMLAVIQTALSELVKQRGIKSIMMDTGPEAFMDTMNLMTKEMKFIFKELDIEMPESGKFKGSELKEIM